MVRVDGFDKAKPLLTRQTPFLSPVLPLGLREKIKATFGEELSAEEVVERIVAEVRERGDKALFDCTEKLDGVRLNSLEVNHEEVLAAYHKVDEKLISALKLAARRIKAFQLKIKRKSQIKFFKRGLGCQTRPLNRIGIYVPGGGAAYPSTVLMTALPARVAGVKEIIMVTPPQKDGTVSPATLVAADIAQVSRIFKVGGAQAIAALAFGTDSIPKVDKICGPGNIFVLLAKKKVYGIVDIDGLQGPSEIVIIADDSANPGLCAAELLAQVEHDILASAILITASPELAEEVDKEIKKQLEGLERQTIAAQALEKSLIVTVNSPGEAIELVNLYAPEHLLLMVKKAKTYIKKISHVGCIFSGDSSVVMGDYVAGPSHVLPTGGSARFSSPLSVSDFLKVTNLVALDKTEVKRMGQIAVTIARAEGLTAHARVIEMRLRENEPLSRHTKADKT